jgi:hypothetical protein
MPLKEALFWVGITVFGTGLFFLVEGGKNMPFAIGLTVLGALVIVYSVVAHHKPGVLPRVPVWLPLILTWVVFGYDIYDRHSSGVAPAFKQTYQQYKTALGRPTEQLSAKGIYQAWHEHAVVIWVKADEAFYVAKMVDSEKDSSWQLIDDSHFEDERQQENWKLYDDAKLRTMFRPLGLPDNRYPPWAGVASHWLRNPGYWKELVGWRRSHCGLDPRFVFFQRFEKGTIIGPVRRNATVDNEGELFVFLNGGGWRSAAVQGDCPILR